ncbi:hypothetical protein [Clostridium sp. YIM B02551]|uniref:hypothetical protein n=1 Tax=Clostridium sp. YIM B02551 TaxID=2910679 RepID=UPI001EE9DBC6|nr:hypothetical protein [Clostridium sp. YIM B02551]
MTRKEIFDILDPVYPCYAIGEHEGLCKEPHIVLKFDNQINSLNNSQGGWQIIHIFCYVPLGDITELDQMIIKVKELLKGKLEDTGTVTPEIIDESIKAYTRRLTYKKPKEVV